MELKLPMSERAGSTPYVTPFGLVRETSLSREVVEAAAERLKRAGLLEAVVDDERGYESWRVSEGSFGRRGDRWGRVARWVTSGRLLCRYRFGLGVHDGALSGHVRRVRVVRASRVGR